MHTLRRWSRPAVIDAAKELLLHGLAHEHVPQSAYPFASMSLRLAHHETRARRHHLGEAMEQLEQSFTTSMGGMKQYDPFMELNVGMWTSDLDHYLTAFKADTVPYFASKFTSTSTGKTYYTATIQIPGSLADGAGSMHLIELISNSSAILSSQSNLYTHPVQKASSESLLAAESRSKTA